MLNLYYVIAHLISLTTFYLVCGEWTTAWPTATFLETESLRKSHCGFWQNRHQVGVAFCSLLKVQL